MAMRCVAVGTSSDQLDFTNLAIAEALLREAQIAEHYYKNAVRDQDGKSRKDRKLGGLPLEEIDFCSNAQKSVLDAMVFPGLMEHIGKAMEHGANIQKQSRKAREERAMARKRP